MCDSLFLFPLYALVARIKETLPFQEAYIYHAQAQLMYVTNLCLCKSHDNSRSAVRGDW